MRLINFTPAILLATAAAAQSWAGTSNYFLQSLDDAAQTAHIKKLGDAGVKVLRLWVRVQDDPKSKPCEKGSLRHYSCPALEEWGSDPNSPPNQATLDTLDRTLKLIQDSGTGIKVILSPHDANSIFGGSGQTPDAYTDYKERFYTDPQAIQRFDKRLKTILDYKGIYTQKVWKEFSDLIVGFDLQNEPFINKGDQCSMSREEVQWVCDRSTNLRRNLLPAGSPIRILSGGLGGDVDKGCGTPAIVQQCADLDVFAIHTYPGGNQKKKFEETIKGWKNFATQFNKHIYVEEIAINWYDNPKFEIARDFKDYTDALNSQGVPWLSWSIVPEVVQQCEASYKDDKDPGRIPFNQPGVDIAAAMSGANNAQPFPLAWQI